MKELRFKASGGVWRTAFAFDPERKAILLVAGDKSSVSEQRFYKQLIKKTDEHFSTYTTPVTAKTRGNITNIILVATGGGTVV
jgi:hypothetical protein